MGNQESVPANSRLIKKKKTKPNQKPINRQQNNNIQKDNTYQYINKNNNQNRCNLNEYGKKLLNRENIPIPKKMNITIFQIIIMK